MTNIRLALLGTIADLPTPGSAALVDSGVFVQAQVGAGHALTLGWTPTPSNYLICLCEHWQNNPFVGSGWTQVFSNNGSSNGGLFIAWRLLDGTDTTAQVPFTISGGSNGIAMFEISGIDISTLQQTNFKEVSSAGPETLTITANGDNTIVVGMFLSAGTAGQSIVSDSGATFGPNLMNQTMPQETPSSITAFNAAASNTDVINAVITWGSTTDMYGIIFAAHP